MLPSFSDHITIILLSFHLKLAHGGLAVDQIYNHLDARYGDECDFEAYRAFRIPILDIMIQKFGEYEEQNVMMYKFENYTYLENGVPVKYDHVPPKFLDLICASKTNPLMCRPPDDGAGRGTCVCLEMDVKELIANTENTVTHRVRTRPFTYEFHLKHKIDLSKTSKRPETSTEGSDANATTTSSSSTASAKRKRRAPDSSAAGGGNQTKSDDAEGDGGGGNDAQQRNGQKGDNMDMTISYTRCLARPYSFCGPPFILCQPYETHRHKLTSSCVYGTCASSAIMPSFLVFILFIISCSFDTYEKLTMQ